MPPPKDAAARSSKIHHRHPNRRFLRLLLRLLHPLHFHRHPNRPPLIQTLPRPFPASGWPRVLGQGLEGIRVVPSSQATVGVRELRWVPPAQTTLEVPVRKDQIRAIPDTHWAFPARCRVFPGTTLPIPAPRRARSSKWRAGVATGSRIPSRIQDLERARRFRPCPRDVVFHAQLEQVAPRIQRR